MTIHMTHDTCDFQVGQSFDPVCGTLSPNYEVWPQCRSCLIDVCPKHQAPGSQQSDEGSRTCLCIGCRDAGEESVS